MPPSRQNTQNILDARNAPIQVLPQVTNVASTRTNTAFKPGDGVRKLYELNIFGPTMLPRHDRTLLDPHPKLSLRMGRVLLKTVGKELAIDIGYRFDEVAGQIVS